MAMSDGRDGQDGRDLDDELRRAMRAEADRAQPDHSSWSRIAERRAAGRSGRAWRWGALAVAAAAAVLLVAVLVWPRDDGDEVITVDSTAVATTVLPDVTVAPTTEPVPSTAPTTEQATTTTATTSTTVAPVGHPTTAVAVTEDGRLVVLDTRGSSAVEVRELDRGPDPRVVPEEGETAVLTDPALSPDGGTVYYSLCCEPVVGVLFSAVVDGSSPPVNLGYGTFPTVSPTGDRLAVVQYDAIVVRDLTGGTPEQSYPDTDHAGTLIDLAWSVDGRSLYYVRYEGTTSQLVQLSLDTGQGEVIATSEAGLRFPLAGVDGTATVVEQCCADGSAGTEPSVIVGVGGSTVREDLPLPLLAREAHEVFELRVDLDGGLSWVQWDLDTGTISGGGALGGPYRDAAW
jgi:hypothetical protein